MTRNSAPWLPEDAADYASKLRRDPNIRTTIQQGRPDMIGLTFNNDLSKRILLDPKMKPVWNYINSLGADPYRRAPIWKYFLIEVQIAAQGPKSRDLRLMSDIKSDISDVKKHINAIKRFIKRYSESELTLWKLNPSLALLERKLEISDVETARKEYSVPIDAILDHIPEWLSINTTISPPLSSPNHPDAPYHYFVREVYSFFIIRDDKFNKWSLLSRISNATGQFTICDSNKARGTCRDLAQEFASPF